MQVFLTHPLAGTHSSGTVRDFHPIPFSSDGPDGPMRNKTRQWYGFSAIGAWGRGGFLGGGHPTYRVFRRGLRGFHGLSFIIKPDFIDYITRCMTTICTLSVSPLCGFAGRYLRFCPQISPSLSADIPALARRYLRPGPEISPLVGFHAPINSANGYYIEYVKSA